MEIIDLGWPWRLLRAIVAKRCEIEPRIDRKLNIGFHMTWKSSTFDDLEGHWQPVRLAIPATAGLLVVYLGTVIIVGQHSIHWRSRWRPQRPHSLFGCIVCSKDRWSSNAWQLSSAANRFAAICLHVSQIFQVSF